MNIHAVPFKPLGGLYEQDDLDAVTSVIANVCRGNGSFFPLPEEANFQNAFANHEGAAHAVTVNSCGTALDLCMMALNISAGDEVVTTPLTFVCTATCAAARGAKVVFADIDPVTMNLDPQKVWAKISKKTKAIIPIHFAGLACDVDAFDEIARRTGVPIIYDCAHAVGALWKGQPIGGRGQASCYSFQSNKNMTTLGEGGAVTTNDPEFAEKVRRKKTFGYVYGPALRVVTIGFNYRMSKPQLAVGLTQLAKVGRVISERQTRMARMDELLKEVDEIICPAGHGREHGSHLYVIRVDTDRVPFSADEFAKRLKDQYQVGTAKHYPIVWGWEAFKNIDCDKNHCEWAEKVSRQVLSLPIFPDTTFDDLDYIAWAIKEVISDSKKGSR